jgi:hypothetical protein
MTGRWKIIALVDHAVSPPWISSFGREWADISNKAREWPTRRRGAILIYQL